MPCRTQKLYWFSFSRNSREYIKLNDVIENQHKSTVNCLNNIYNLEYITLLL